MEITHYETSAKKIQLSKETVDEITIKRLKQMVYPGEYLREKKDGMWLKQDDPHWRHGSVSEDDVRKATELDIAVFAVISAIRGEKP
jgi:hypothetical protein